MTVKRPIAIVSAMHDELSQLLALMPDEHKQTRAGREFWLGHWGKAMRRLLLTLLWWRISPAPGLMRRLACCSM